MENSRSDIEKLNFINQINDFYISEKAPHASDIISLIRLNSQQLRELGSAYVAKLNPDFIHYVLKWIILFNEENEVVEKAVEYLFEAKSVKIKMIKIDKNYAKFLIESKILPEEIRFRFLKALTKKDKNISTFVNLNILNFLYHSLCDDVESQAGCSSVLKFIAEAASKDEGFAFFVNQKLMEGDAIKLFLKAIQIVESGSSSRVIIFLKFSSLRIIF